MDSLQTHRNFQKSIFLYKLIHNTTVCPFLLENLNFLVPRTEADPTIFSICLQLRQIYRFSEANIQWWQQKIYRFKKFFDNCMTLFLIEIHIKKIVTSKNKFSLGNNLKKILSGSYHKLGINIKKCNNVSCI